MYGLTILRAYMSEMVPAKKPTHFMGNGQFILNELSTRCDKTSAYRPLIGRRANTAQEYSYELCLHVQGLIRTEGIRSQRQDMHQHDEVIGTHGGYQPCSKLAGAFSFRFAPPHLLELCSVRR